MDRYRNPEGASKKMWATGRTQESWQAHVQIANNNQPAAQGRAVCSRRMHYSRVGELKEHWEGTVAVFVENLARVGPNRDMRHLVSFPKGACFGAIYGWAQPELSGSKSSGCLAPMEDVRPSESGEEGKLMGITRSCTKWIRNEEVVAFEFMAVAQCLWLGRVQIPEKLVIKSRPPTIEQRPKLAH